MSQFTTDEAQAKLADAMDPSNNYSYDDFMDEYGSIPVISGPTKMDISFVNESRNQDPDWETNGSAGFDLRASEYGSLKTGEYKVIPTGLFFDLPENFEMQIRPRSGLAAKKGVTVLNSPGTIDSDYTGEIKVILINHGKETFIVTKGDRIAQAVISTVTAKNIINLNKVKSIDKETDRGSGGFGSTGVK
jgi:dUTP pyrophosphatase|tara:strand:- start:204 stop:773 length:570 start_codon:yes stop_codon:yes gene_type:complete